MSAEVRSRYERAAMGLLRAWTDLPATFRQEFVRWLADIPGYAGAVSHMLDNLNKEVDK